jgi:hypothetical protein
MKAEMSKEKWGAAWLLALMSGMLWALFGVVAFGVASWLGVHGCDAIKVSGLVGAIAVLISVSAAVQR